MTALACEDRLVAALTAGLARSPLQLHGTGESDAELIRVPGRELVLAVTTDSIVEEVETGLYADPELLGWMTVTVNLSDLAAVGADPLGLVLNLTVPPDCPPAFLDAFRSGVDAACRAAGTVVLGGDTNLSPHPQFGATAVGLIDGGRPITRRGARPGELLFVSGPLGAGSALALRQLVLGTAGCFRPAARLREGRLVRHFASCAMDTSDGLIDALDRLGALNGVGFEVDLEAGKLLDPDAATLAAAHGVAPWMLLAGPHGEFELVFTVPPRAAASFRAEAGRIGWDPVPVGRVTPAAGVCLVDAGTRRRLDTARVRRLAAGAATDVDAYLAGLERSLS
jgi:thiamine-monophosphate kinase